MTPSSPPPARVRRRHAFRGSHGRFVPRSAFPDTGTPNVIVQPPGEKLLFDRGDRVRTSEEVVPRHDRTEKLPRQEFDWLDRDAARTAFVPFRP